jgi:hypothetical protein
MNATFVKMAKARPDLDISPITASTGRLHPAKDFQPRHLRDQSILPSVEIMTGLMYFAVGKVLKVVGIERDFGCENPS